MVDSAETDGSDEQRQVSESSRFLRWLIVGLAVFVVCALAYLILVIPTGTRFLSTTSVGERQARDVNALTTAANEQLVAFYNPNYKSIDTMISAVQAGSTGKFRDAWEATAVTLKAGAAQRQVVGNGSVKQIAVHQVSGDSATLLAVVHQNLRNVDTRGVAKSGTCPAATVCSTFHLWLTYQRINGQWKMADLEYVQ